MKKIYLIYSGVITLLLLCPSCKDEDDNKDYTPDLPKDPTEIQVKATIARDESRQGNANLAVDFQWSDTDSIGVFMTQNESVSSAGYAVIPDSRSEDRREARFSGTLHWVSSASQHRFYAYYPKAPGVTDPEKIPVTIPAEQTQKGGSSDHLNDYHTLIASPLNVTSPGDMTDPEKNKTVNPDFVSAFSIIEFRFASYRESDLKIKKITLTSDGGSLAVTGGLLDLTVPDFSSGFARISGGTKSASVSLNITDPLSVPVSGKMTVIPDNDATKPANPEIVFPASLTVLPNSYTETVSDETWTVELETNRDNFTRTVNRLNMKPGEKYIVEYVVITSDTTGMGGGDPVDDTPGTPWDGIVAAPPASQVDNTAKTVIIKQPGELAWLAEIVNRERQPELGVDTFFRGYTVKLDNNIHLGNNEWEPIGISIASGGNDYIFMGTFDGQGHLVSNFKITSAQGKTALYAGLFGCSGAPAIRNIRVKDAVINLPSLTTSSLVYVGGIVGYIPASYQTTIENCSFSGTIDVNFGTHTWSVGGIVGYAMRGNITACRSSATITGSNNFANNSARADIGGIVGNAGLNRGPVYIKDCEFTGMVNGIGQWNAGGIAGMASGGSRIAASKNTGTIECNGRQAVIGGIVGVGRCDIISSYNTGDIEATNGGGIYEDKGVGGIAGELPAGIAGLAGGNVLKGCYSIGTVTSTQALINQTGNVVGRIKILIASYAPDYSKIINNYYSPKALTGDTPKDLGANRITRFAAGAWPSTDMDGWGVGDGSEDNKYWNADFPTSSGSTYPILHWETVR